MTWFKNGDKNTKFFHSYVNRRRRKLRISEITSLDGDTLNTEENIGNEVVNYFHNQFSQEYHPRKYEMLSCIPKLISRKDNEYFESMPDREEIKKAVFSLIGDSAGGPDGFPRSFYHQSWDIIEEDICGMVRAFFCGA